MNTVNKALLGALVVQTALVAFTRWPSGGPAEPRDLVGFPQDDLAVIRITGRKAKDEEPQPPLELRREGAGWVIASEDGFPADDKLLAPTLEAIGSLTARDPIATSASSHTSLEVADGAFTRKLDLESKGGDKRTLYIGAGQGKSAHVRVDGEDDVYDVRGFNAWSLSENANRYFERDFLKVDASEVKSLRLQRPDAEPLELTRAEDGTWTFDGPPPPWAATGPEGPTLDQAATTAWISRILSVRMADPAGRNETPEMGLDDASATIVSWTMGEPPETRSYRVGASLGGTTGRRYLRSDTLSFVLEAMEANLKPVIEPDLPSLLTGGGGMPGMPGGMPGMPGGMPGMPGGSPHGGGGSPHGGGAPPHR